MKKKGVAALLAAMAFSAVAPQAGATDAKDLQVIGRALSFVDGGSKGEVTVVIVYADNAAGSKAEADAVAALMGSGLTAGDVTMKPKVVAIGSLGKADGAAAVYVPAGMSAHYDALKSTGKLTVSTDKSCAQTGGCVVAVQSAPKVEIIVNRSAAAAAKVAFSAAFRMMIKEV